MLTSNGRIGGFEPEKTLQKLISGLIVRTVVFLKKVTCPFRVNFEFSIELVRLGCEEPILTWCQFFTPREVLF